MKVVSFFSVLLLTACVTINIYFPAAAAEKVADEIIKEIQLEQGEPDSGDPLEPRSNIEGMPYVAYRWVDLLLNVVIPPAQAAGVDLSVDTAEIRQLRAKMRTRFGSLKSFYKQGIVGAKSDGFIASRGNVPLKDRNKVNKLIAAENTDRQHLYQAIANANGHPEWFAQIKSTFATRWVSNTKPGWWYQSSNGRWKQK